MRLHHANLRLLGVLVYRISQVQGLWENASGEKEDDYKDAKIDVEWGGSRGEGCQQA